MSSEKERRSLLKEASSLLQNKEYDKAEPLCKTILENDPENYNALVFLAACCDNLDKKDEALDLFKRCVELKPDNMLGWQGLAKFYEKHIDDFPNDAINTFYKVAMMCEQSNNTSKAIDYLKLLVQFSLLYQSDLSWEELQRACQKILDKEPNNVAALQLFLIIQSEDFLVTHTSNEWISTYVDALSAHDELNSTLRIGSALPYMVQGDWMYARGVLFDDTCEIKEDILFLCFAAKICFETREHVSCEEFVQRAVELLADERTKIFRRCEISREMKNIRVENYLLSERTHLLDKDDVMSDPDLGHTLVLLVLVELGLLDEATEWIDKSISQAELTWKERMDVSLCNALLASHGEAYEEAESLAKSMEGALTSFQRHLLARVFLSCDNVEEALKNFKASVVANDQYFANFLYAGRIFEADGNFEEAEENYMIALQQFGDNEDIKVDLGRVRIKLRKLTEAIEILNSIDISARTKDVWLQLGLASLREGPIDLSIRSLQQAVKLDVHNALMWDCLGDAYIKRGSYGTAIESFKKSLKINEDNIHALVQCGKVYFTIEDYANAEVFFLRALELKAMSLLALKGISEVYVARVRLALRECFVKEALDHTHVCLHFLGKAHQMEVNHVWVCELIGDVLTMFHAVKDPDVRFEIPESLLLGEEPSSSNDAVTLLNIDDALELAAKYYKKCIQLDPSASDYWYSLGLNLLWQWLRFDAGERKIKKGLLNKSGTSIRKALLLDQARSNYWNTLGVVYACQGNSFFEAQHCFCKAVELEKQHTEAGANLGFLYVREDKLELGVEAWKSCQAHSPHNTNSWLGLAQFTEEDQGAFYLTAAAMQTDTNVTYKLIQNIFTSLKRGSHLDENFNFKVLTAIRCAEKILKLKSSDWRLWNDYGLLLQHVGHHSAAKSAIETALSHAPEGKPRTLVKHNVMFATAWSKSGDPGHSLDDPDVPNFAQLSLQAYWVSVRGDMDRAVKLYENLVLNARQLSGKGSLLEREAMAALACHAKRDWSRLDWAHTGLTSALAEDDTDKNGLPLALSRLRIALALSEGDVELCRRELEKVEGETWSYGVHLMAGLNLTVKGPSSSATFLKRYCLRYPNDPTGWFYLALFLWRGKNSTLDAVLYALWNAVKLSARPMLRHHATLLNEVVQEEGVNSHEVGSRLLKTAVFCYPDENRLMQSLRSTL